MEGVLSVARLGLQSGLIKVPSLRLDISSRGVGSGQRANDERDDHKQLIDHLVTDAPLNRRRSAGRLRGSQRARARNRASGREAASAAKATAPPSFCPCPSALSIAPLLVGEEGAQFVPSLAGRWRGWGGGVTYLSRPSTQQRASASGTPTYRPVLVLVLVLVLLLPCHPTSPSFDWSGLNYIFPPTQQRP